MGRSTPRGLARWVARIFRSPRPATHWHAVAPRARLRLEALESRVVPIATVTTVLSSLDPSIVGEAVTFTADVETIDGALVGDGTVEFQIGDNSYGPESVSDGVAAYVDSSLAAGSYAVSAAYTGNDKYGNSSGDLNSGQTVDQSPGFTSVNTTTFVEGSYGSFTVMVYGFPAPTLSESGPLPAGVTFNAATGLLSGAPATSDPSGPYSLTFTANNKVGSPATQSFTLVLDQIPTITSPDTTTFAVGSFNDFTVTAVGYPSPSLGYSGTPPAGVTYDTDTGVLSGTPDATDPGGVYTLTFTASNGVGSPATQTFYLVLDQPPVFTSADNTTFVDGSNGSFTVTAAGSPVPTLSESGALPAGVTFDADTGVLSGTPAATDPGGVYTLTFTAANGIGSPATQSFFLVVDQPPTITSADDTTFFDGSAGSFTVTATGSPVPTLSESGALPAGVTFDAGTGVLSGTPEATDPGGVYFLTFTAGNGIGSPAAQTFYLTLDQPPAFTSANNTNLVAGSYGSFTVTATGTPAPTLSESGSLPVGITFDPGTGTLSGIPASNAYGFYSLTFTADNGVGSLATQSFGLWVLPPATSTTTTLTSTSNPTDYGQAATFTATVTPASGVFDSGGTVTLEFDGDPSTDVTEGLTDGVATFVVSNLAPGTHTAAATYSGDTGFATSTGSLSPQQVVIPTTTTTLTADPDPLVLFISEQDNGVGEFTVTLTATVTNVGDPENVPTGTLDFYDSTDGINLGTATLDQNGQATIGIPYLNLGAFYYVATYTPAGNFVGSSGTLTEPVQVFTTTTVTASPALGVAGQPATLTASIANGYYGEGGDPTGTVDFVDESTSPGTDLGSAPVVDGTATLTTSFSTSGTHDVAANYIPSGIFAGSQASTNIPIDPADYWTNPAGGNWDDPANWSAGVPTAAEDVYFGMLNPSAVIAIGPMDVADNVTATGPLTLTGIVNGSGSDSITIGGDMTVTGPLTTTVVGEPLAINVGGVLTVGGNMTINVGNGSDTVTVGGVYVLQNVFIQPGGSLSGSGNVMGNLVLDGALDMGVSIGAVTVAGSYTQGPTGILTIKAGGPMADEVDQLSVMGVPTLGGTLNINLLNGFMPDPGQPLPYLDVKQPVIGNFANFDFPTIDGLPELQPIILAGGLGVELLGQSVSVSQPGVPAWLPEGPAEGIDDGPRTNATPDNQSVGAISSVVDDPANGTVYAGTVGGGVWAADEGDLGLTLQANATSPPGPEPSNLWTPLTDDEASLAVSTMALDPTDPTGNTLWVGTGSVSSATSSTIPAGGYLGGPAVGLLETTNGGLSWTNVGRKYFYTPILSIVPEGQMILVGTEGQGLWQSTNGGITFQQVQFYGLDAGPDLSSAVIASIVADPQYPGRFYAAVTATEHVTVVGDVKKGSNTVTDWTEPSQALGPAVGETIKGTGIPKGTTIIGVSGTSITLSAAATATQTGDTLSGPSFAVSGVYESVNDGAGWFEIDYTIPAIVNSPNLALAVSVLPDGDTNLFVVTTAVTTIPNPDGGNLVTGVYRTEVPANPAGAFDWISCPGPTENQFVDYEHFDAAADPTDPNAVYVCGWVQCLYRVETSEGESGLGTATWQAVSGGALGNPHDDQRSLGFFDGALLATGDGGLYALPDPQDPSPSDHWEGLNGNIQDTEFFQVAYDPIDGLIVGGAQDNGTPIQTSPNTAFSWNAFDGGDGGAVAVDSSGSAAIIYATGDGVLSWTNLGGGPDSSGNLNPSGLNDADAQTYLQENGTDSTYLIAGTDDGEPGILLGMTSVYLVNEVGNPLDLFPPSITGNVSALTGENAAGVAYFATNTGQLYISPGLTPYGYPDPFVQIVSPFAPGTYAVKIVGDPSYPDTVYVLTNTGSVLGNINVNGGLWQTITGDLNQVADNPIPMQIIRQGNADVLLVGALGGVYRTTVTLGGVSPSLPQQWTLFGTGLPNVQVSSLEYVPSANLLVAGTYGRGAWEIPYASTYLSDIDQAGLAATNGTLVIETDPSRPGNAEVLSDVSGASVQQVLADNNVVFDEPWAGLSLFTVYAASETVDVLDLPSTVQLTVDGSGSGLNTVNVGSTINQLNTIAGGLMVSTGTVGPGGATYLNVNDQGDPGQFWTIQDGNINEDVGTISYDATITGVTINTSGGGTFDIDDTGETNLTLNTGNAGDNSIIVNDTSPGTTLTINNPGIACSTSVFGTGAASQTTIDDTEDSTLAVGFAANGAQGVLGNISLRTKDPDGDTLSVSDMGDYSRHKGKRVVTVTSTAIANLAPGTISYAKWSLSSLTLVGAADGTIWNVQGTPIPNTYFVNVNGKKGGGLVEEQAAPTTTNIFCASGDGVNIGDPGTGLQDVYGTVNVDAPSASSSVDVTVNDQATTYQSPQLVNVTIDSVTGLDLGWTTINYGVVGSLSNTLTPGGVDELTVEVGAGGPGVGGTTFEVGDPTNGMMGGPGTVNLSAEGSGNSVVAVGPASMNLTWSFQESSNGQTDSFTQGGAASVINFSSIQALTGGPGENFFDFIQVGFNGSIDGGPGGNSTLDFTSYGSTSLDVELTENGSENGVQGAASEGTTFDDINTVLGDPQESEWNFGTTEPAYASYSGNFSNTLTVAGFANMSLIVTGSFSGELLAPTEGAPANPVGEIYVDGDVVAGAVIKVGFAVNVGVGGNLYGTIKAFGTSPSAPSIEGLLIIGSVEAGAQILEQAVGMVTVDGSGFAGVMSEMSPTADFDSVYIGGSFLSTGLIYAPAGGTLSVAGDFSGEAVIENELDDLIVGGTLDGIMSAGSYGSQQFGGPVTGELDTGLTTAPPLDIGAGDVAGLTQAIYLANFIGIPNIINLAAGSTYNLTMPSSDTGGPTAFPVVLTNLSINGNGATLLAAGSTPFRLFLVAPSANLSLTGLTLSGGSSTDGGAIFNDGTLALDNDLFADNSATARGGAVYTDAMLTQSGTTFSNNTAPQGPNVYYAVITGSTVTTVVDDGPNPSVAGQAVTFVVNVTGGVPDGEGVTLEDESAGDAIVGSGTLAGGSATIAVSDLNVGSHNLIAVYGGDSNLAGSQSGPATQVVDQSPAFTSQAAADFSVGDSNSFTVTAGGNPAPTLSEDPSDLLPAGVSFDPSTGVLSGTPALGTEGVYTLNFTADNGIGSDASQTFILTVDPAQPVIVWPTPAAITYGTPLPASDLDATANVLGTFVYDQAPGDILPAVDAPDLSVTFTPEDTTDYATVTATVAIEVDPAPLTVYANTQTMTYGTAVPALTFSAYGFVNGDTIDSLPGSLATTATPTSYVGTCDITLGTLGIIDPNAPGFNSNYDITFIGAQLAITPATPVITWSPPAPIDDQTPLGNAQLDATANVSGTFAYSPAAGTVLEPGTQQLNVMFYPADGLDYETVSGWVQLTVSSAAAPAITTEPSSQAVAAGSTVTFDAAAAGGPAPTMQWLVNDAGLGFVPISANPIYSVDATGDLTITGVSNYMNGDQFEAVFTNASGDAVTSVATLTVISFPSTTAMINYTPTVLNTEPIVLTVSVDGGGPGGEVVNVEDETNGDAVVSTTGNTLTDGSAALTIPAGALAGGAHLLIAVYGGDGTYAPSRSTPLTEVVDVPATITEQPVAQAAGVGQTATFEAAADGYPTPTVQWMESTDGGNAWADVPGATNPALALTDVDLAESGDEFEAIFTNLAGTATTTPAVLTVIPQPMVDSVSPSTGPESGGTTVTIAGSNLAGATAVDFGIAAATIESDTATQIVVYNPSNAAGVVDVTVTTAGGTSSTSSGAVFTYGAGAVPSVFGVSPATGLPAGGTAVVVSGENFTPASSVMFGDTPAESVTVLSSTSISAAAPAQGAMTGTVDVTVTTAAGTSPTSVADQFGYASPSTSTLSTSSTSDEAGSSITITLQAEDAAKDRLSAGGLTVSFSLASSTGGQGTFGPVTDKGNGTYTATFTGTTAGSNTIAASIDGQPVTSGAPGLTVTPGPIDPARSTINRSASTLPSGSTITVTLQAEDQYGNHLTTGGASVSFGLGSTGGGQGAFGTVTDNGNGTYTATFAGTTAGSNTITASIGGQPVRSGSPAITITPGLASPAESILSIAESEIQSGATTTVTLRAVDADGNNLTTGGATVSFGLENAGGGQGTFGAVSDYGDGTYSATFTGTSAGANTITATIGGQPVTTKLPAVTVSLGSIDPALSYVSLSADGVEAGGDITVTLQAEDAAGNDLTIGGSTVVFALGVGSGAGALSPVTDEGNGTYTATFVGRVAGSVTLTATIDGQPVTSQPPSVTVAPGQASPADSVLSISAASAVAGSPVTVTLQAVDSYGNDLTMGGLTVGFALAATGGGQGTFGPVTDNNNGTYTATFTGTTAGSNTIVATINGEKVTTAPAAIAVTPGPVDAANSMLTLSAPMVQLGGVIDISLRALDAYGNADPTGITSAILALGGGGTAGTLSAVSEQGAGVYTATFTGTADGGATLLAVLNGSTVGSGPTPQLTVTGNAVDPGKSKLTATGTVAAGVETTVTLQAEDSKGNKETAGGLTVTFGLGSAKGAQGTFGPVTDNGTGTYTAVFTGTLAGSNTITATIDGQKATSKSSIKVTPGPVDLMKSVVTVSAATVAAGKSMTVTFQPEDAYGNKVTAAVSGLTFGLGSGSGGGTFGKPKHTSSGTYTATFTGITAGSNTIVVEIDGQVVSSTPAMTVTPGTASTKTSMVTLSVDTVAVNGAITIMLQAEDADGNDETSGGLKVAFKLGSTKGGQGTFGKVTDNKNGTYSVTFTATAAGTNTIEATISGAKVTSAPTITVTG